MMWISEWFYFLSSKSMKNLQAAELISNETWDRLSASVQAVEGGEDC